MTFLPEQYEGRPFVEWVLSAELNRESSSVAVMNAVGNIAMECIIETKASRLLQLSDGLRDLQVTFEEGRSAA